MGSIGGLIGIGSSPGAQGLGFSATSAPIQSPTTNEQADIAYQQAQSGIAGQQAFLQALQAQGGIQNQSDVYNQLSGVAQGTGPNPAQAMLANATGANTANQAALMAGQRGAGANVGLIARQAAQQGAANQQNAAGQGAALQANQSLNAIGQMGNIAGQQVANQAAATGALAGSQQNEQGLLLNAIGQQNAASVANQKNINDVNAGMAQSGGKAQMGLYQGVSGLVGSGLLGGGGGGGGGMIPGMAAGGQVTQHLAYGDVVAQPNLGANLNFPAANVQMPVSPIAPRQDAQGKPKSHLADALSGNNSAVPQQDPFEKAGSGIGTNIAKGVGSIFGKGTPSPGSYTPDQQMSNGAANAQGQAVENNNRLWADTAKANGQEIDLANYDQGGSIGYDMSGQSPNPNAPTADGGKEEGGGPMDMVKKLLPLAMMALSKGGKVPAMVSPGEIYLPPKEAEKVAKGKKSPMEGERIPGKAAVAGNDLRNDTVPKTLEEGGIVIPRSDSMDKDKAAAFVAAHFKRKGLSRG